MCLRTISRDVSANNMKKTGLNECVYKFFVNYGAFGTSDFVDVRKYLMKKYKKLFRLIKKIFIRLLASVGVFISL